MSDFPIVSVVIPAFNRVGTIREAVKSVLSQSHADLELLVVDDGSSDGTMSALADMTDPRLRLLANPRNMGPGAARNTGIRAARGDWVAFQDSDDEWLPDKLAKQLARIAQTGPGCVAAYCGMLIDTPKDGSLGPGGRPQRALRRRDAQRVHGPGRDAGSGQLHRLERRLRD